MAWRERVSQSFEWLFHRFAQGKPHLGDSEAADISTVSFDRYLNLVSLHWVQLIHIRDLRNGENNETYTCDTISIYIYSSVYVQYVSSRCHSLSLSGIMPLFFSPCLHKLMHTRRAVSHSKARLRKEARSRSGVARAGILMSRRHSST